MIELEEARKRILDVISPVKSETIELSEIQGRILAENLIAPINLPTFDNSAMDGFAVRASEATTGVRLSSIAEVAAGTFLRTKFVRVNVCAFLRVPQCPPV